MLRVFVIAPLLWLLATPLWADARTAVLMDVLKIDALAQILHAEGLDYAETLNRDMLNGQGGPAWQVQVDAIYDPQRMTETLRASLEAALDADQREAVIAFFASDTGAQIVALENAARAAIGQPDVETAARERFADLDGTDDPRLARITTLIDNASMIDRNVTAAMNANYQFLRGLGDGGAIEMTQAEMLADVAQQHDEITQDTTGWLYGYFLLAYSPLDDAALDAYLAFSQTDAGAALNTALFDGFGKAYAEISYGLGRAVALNMVADAL